MNVCGPYTTGSYLTLCPTDSYMICIECDVQSASLSFQWNFGPLGPPALFNPRDSVGDRVKRGPITVTLTENEEVGSVNVYKSQFRVLSTNLSEALESHGGMIKIGCEVSDSERDHIVIMNPGMLSYFLQNCT